MRSSKLQRIGRTCAVVTSPLRTTTLLDGANAHKERAVTPLVEVMIGCRHVKAAEVGDKHRGVERIARNKKSGQKVVVVEPAHPGDRR